MNRYKGTIEKTIRNNKGFTMIEIIAVIVILIILAVVAATRISSSQADLIAQIDIAKSNLRFVQLKALQDDVNSWSISFLEKSYTISCSGSSCPTTIVLPSENSATHSFPSSITAENKTVVYDSWGAPKDGAVTVTLTEGTKNNVINIAAATGFITVTP